MLKVGYARKCRALSLALVASSSDDCLHFTPIFCDLVLCSATIVRDCTAIPDQLGEGLLARSSGSQSQITTLHHVAYLSVVPVLSAGLSLK